MSGMFTHRTLRLGQNYARTYITSFVGMSERPFIQYEQSHIWTGLNVIIYIQI